MLNEDIVRKLLEITLEEARLSLKEGSYPIGSIITDESGTILAKTRNRFAEKRDVTSHAEIIGLSRLGKAVDKDTPANHVLFSSLEPCFGCSFFIARSNIRSIYSALKDPHKGGMGDLKKQEQFNRFFGNIKIINEPFADLKEESIKLLRQYFINIGNHKAAGYYSHENPPAGKKGFQG